MQEGGVERMQRVDSSRDEIKLHHCARQRRPTQRREKLIPNLARGETTGAAGWHDLVVATFAMLRFAHLTVSPLQRRRLTPGKVHVVDMNAKSMHVRYTIKAMKSKRK